MERFLDSKAYRILSKVSDLILVNLLFILCSLPLFTLGASLRALYRVCERIQNEEDHICRTFLTEFRDGFGYACGPFLIWLLVSVFVILDGVIVLFYWKPAFGDVLMGLLILAGILLLFTGSYLAPVMAAGKRQVRDVFFLSFYLSLRYLPRTLAVCALDLLPVALLVIWTYAFPVILPFWFFIGFSLTAYLNARLLGPALKELSEERKP